MGKALAGREWGDRQRGEPGLLRRPSTRLRVDAGSRRETPGNLLPSENKGRRRARTWLVPGPHRCPPGPGDNLLHPLAQSFVLLEPKLPTRPWPWPHRAVRYDITCFRSLEHDLYSQLLLFVKVSSVPGFGKACSPQYESGDDVKERFHWFAFLSSLPFLFN